MTAEERERLEALAASWEADAERVRQHLPIPSEMYAHDSAIMRTLLTCAHDLRRVLAEEAAA